jgi:hypothetical protein
MGVDSEQPPQDSLSEEVRRRRLREAGMRSPSVNLMEAIVLSRKLFELRDAARESVERADV